MSAAVRQWVDVCAVDDVMLDRGAAALVGGTQIALFRVSPTGESFAISNYDPFSRAYVLSRGIVGSAAGVLKVTSPMYKHAFDLRTGVSFDDESVVLPTFPLRVRDGRIEVAFP